MLHPRSQSRALPASNPRAAMSSLALVRAACDRHTYGTARVTVSAPIVTPMRRALSLPACLARLALWGLGFALWFVALAYAMRTATP